MNDHQPSHHHRGSNGFKARPASPPPPPPPRNTPPKSSSGGYSSRIEAPPSQKRQAQARLRSSEDYSGVNKRELEGHKRLELSCNGNSVGLHQASSKAALAAAAANSSHIVTSRLMPKVQATKPRSTSYEVYHINHHHHTVGVPYPTSTSSSTRQKPQILSSSYSYFPHAPHSISSSAKCEVTKSLSNSRNLEASSDFSQGSCDNAPATPDSLDSLVGGCSELEEGIDSAVSSPFQRLQSEDYDEITACSSTDRLQCTSSVLSPLSLTAFDDSIDCSNLNNNTIKRSPKDKDRNSNSSSPLDNLNMASSSQEIDSSSSSASSTSNGCHPSMSSSLTPSTIVATVTVASSPSSTTLVRGANSPSASAVVNQPQKQPLRTYYYDGGGGVGVLNNNLVLRDLEGNCVNLHGGQQCQSMEQQGCYQEASTMLRRSRSQQFREDVVRCGPSRSVGHTPPLPLKNVHHYMPLQAYQDVMHHSLLQQHPRQAAPIHNPQIHYAQQAPQTANEFVLTPKQAQQIQQSLVNRYATIGRNYHINANVSSDQTRVDVHHHHQKPRLVHRSHDNLAMRINNNLTSSQTLAMKKSEDAGAAAETTPLTDVRKLLESCSTPPTVSIASKHRKTVNTVNDDIQSAESTTECCDEEGRLSLDDDDDLEDDDDEQVIGANHEKVRLQTEESVQAPEQVRKNTLLSTLLMQSRPQRKPPFTIEGAMSKILRRHKKKNDEETEDEGSLEGTVKKMLTNGQQQQRQRRRKASPAPQPPTNSKNNLLENNSLVTSLRQAGSDRELRSKGEPQPPPPGPIEDLPQFPDSDSEFTKPTKKVSY